MHPRLHAFETIENFRDFGDYATTAGRRVRPGRLFRSGHHGRACDADLERLGGLQVGVVVDLRRSVERSRQPSRRHAGFAGQVIESDLGGDGEAPHVTFLKTSDLTPDSGRRFMRDIYGRMPFGPGHIDLFTRYFRALGHSEDAVLIHCAAGKDRTGLLVALTHHLLGVGEADILEDYLLTNTAVRLVERAPEMAGRIREMTGRTPSDDAVVAFMGVEPAYLSEALQAIRERFGSVDAYLEEALGVDSGLRGRIQARLAA